MDVKTMENCEIFTVPKNMLILGHGEIDTILQEISAKTKCRIEVKNSVNDSKFLILNLIGEKESLREAKSILLHKVINSQTCLPTSIRPSTDRHEIVRSDELERDNWKIENSLRLVKQFIKVENGSVNDGSGTSAIVQNVQEDAIREGRSRERDRERSRDRERKIIGLPSITSSIAYIASRTLWLKKVPANCSDSDIKVAVEPCGEARGIRIIANRACAYVTMETRKAAYDVVNRLKEVTVAKKTVKVYWARGPGMNEEMFTEMWDVERGVLAVPHDKLPKDLVKLCEGSLLDLDSLPENKKNTYAENGSLKVIPNPPPAAPVASNIPPNLPPGIPPSFPFPMSGHISRGPLPPGLPPAMFNKRPPPPSPMVPFPNAMMPVPPPPGVGRGHYPPMQPPLGMPAGFDMNRPPPMMWDVERGVLAVPHDKLPKDLVKLCEGSLLDLDSLPENKKNTYAENGSLKVIPNPPPAAPVASNIPPNLPPGIPPSFPFPMSGHISRGPLPPGLPPAMFNKRPPPPSPMVPFPNAMMPVPPPPGVGRGHYPPMQPPLGMPAGFDMNRPPPMMWDVERGVLAVPHDKLPKDLVKLCEGSLLDLDSLPENKKNTYAENGSLKVIPNPPPAAPVASNIPPNLPPGIPPSFPFPMSGHISRGPLPPGLPPAMFNKRPPPPSPMVPFPNAMMPVPPPPGVGRGHYPPMQPPLGMPAGFDMNRPPPMMWDVERGVLAVPHDKLPKDLVKLCEGSLLDLDSLPENKKNTYAENGSLKVIPNPPPAAPVASNIPPNLPPGIPPSFPFPMSGHISRGPLPPGLPPAMFNKRPPPPSPMVPFPNAMMPVPPPPGVGRGHYPPMQPPLGMPAGFDMNRPPPMEKNHQFICRFLGCERTFSRNDNFQRHMRIHTGERPFQCKTCFRSFSRPDYLSKHQNIHLVNKTSTCSNCGDVFRLPGDLRKHVKECMKTPSTSLDEKNLAQV